MVEGGGKRRKRKIRRDVASRNRDAGGKGRYPPYVVRWSIRGKFTRKLNR